MIIAPNNCSPDYRITKSVEMIKKITPNVTLVRMVDLKKDLHKIEMAQDIHAQDYDKSLETLSELKFLSHISFIFYLLLKILLTTITVGKSISSIIKRDREDTIVKQREDLITKKLQEFQSIIADSQDHKNKWDV